MSDELRERTDLVCNNKEGRTIEERDGGSSYSDGGPFYSKVYEDGDGNLYTK